MRRKAFTLVELLVVIGIIALLIGILLPTLSRARLAARKTTVLAQLQQIGVAMASYQAEYRGAVPTNLSEADSDGRALHGLELLAWKYKLPLKLFVNPNTEDIVASRVNADGWPIFAELGSVEIAPTTPAAITPANIGSVVFHCSFAYDHERKRSGRRNASRVYVGDRGDYTKARSFSANWQGKGMCLLWTDEHAEFVTSKSVHEQHDPNIYHHNQYFDDAGVFPGEGGQEVNGDIAVTPDTLDTHLRFFTEDEDNALLPNP